MKVEFAHRDLLERMISLFESYSVTAEVNPPLAQQAARAYDRLGYIRYAVGDNADAERAFRRGLELLDRTDTTLDRVTRATLLNGHGLVLHALGRLSEARDQFQRGESLLVTMVAEHPDDGNCLARLGTARLNLGQLALSQKKWDEGEAALRSALSTAETLIKREPHRISVHHTIALAHHALGKAAHGRCRFAEADEYYRRGSDLCDLLASKSRLTFLRMTNIMALKDRGQNALYLENKSLAESCFQKALAIAEELAHEHPDWPVTSIRLAEVLTTFSEARSKMGQYEKAADLDRRALEAWNRLAEEHPNRPTFRRAAEKVRLRVNDSERAKMKKP